MMTQIPEVGSVWVSRHNEIPWKIVFADNLSVLIECYDGLRTTCDYPDFMERYNPAPRKIKHRRWVNLYADGSTSSLFKSKEEADGLIYTGCETRLIEWEVEE